MAERAEELEQTGAGMVIIDGGEVNADFADLRTVREKPLATGREGEEGFGGEERGYQVGALKDFEP